MDKERRKVIKNELQKKLKALESAVAVKTTIPAQTFLKWDNETMTTTNGYTSVIANIQLGIGDEIKALIPYATYSLALDREDLLHTIERISMICCYCQ